MSEAAAKPKSPRDQFVSLVDGLFAGVDYKLNGPGYREGTSSRKVNEFMTVWRGVFKNLPLLHVTVEQILDPPTASDSTVMVGVEYLLADTTRVDQAVRYSLLPGDDIATLKQHVIFGDTWGRDVPFEPFSDKPEEPLDMMRLVVEKMAEFVPKAP